MSRARPRDGLHLASAVDLARRLALLVALLVALATLCAACDHEKDAPGTCGNGVVESGEDCDGADLASIYRFSSNCLQHGGRDLRIPCLPDCSLDFGICERAGACSDGVIQPDFEDCDGADLGGADCVSLGHSGGTLACGYFCRYEVTGCERCGDDVLSPEHGEVCERDVYCADLGLGNGIARCRDCAGLDVSSCEPAHWVELDSYHRFMTAFLDGTGIRWRAGFITGALPGTNNAREGCPARFDALVNTHPQPFPTEWWDSSLMLSDCHDLILQVLDEDHQVIHEQQWGTPDGELPLAAVMTQYGRIAVFALHAVIPEDPPVPQDAELPISVRLHIVRPGHDEVVSVILFEKTIRLFDLKRAPVLGLTVDGDTWSLLLDAAVDQEIAEPRILTGDFGLTQPPTTFPCAVEALHTGRVLDRLELRRAAGFAPGAFVVHAAMSFVQPEGEAPVPASAQVFLLDTAEGVCELGWTVEVGVGWGPILHFSPMDEPGVLWGFEDRIYYGEPSREWRFTAAGAQNVDGAFRTSLRDHPVHAVRRHDEWLLSGFVDPGFDVPTLPGCLYPADQVWQILSTRVSYPSIGRGWSMCDSRFQVNDLLQTARPDGGWWWTGTLASQEGYYRVFSLDLPPDERF